MIPRLILLAAVLTAALLPVSASAAARATLVSPGRDAVVSSPVELRVRVTREVFEPDATQVHVRLSADGSGPAPGTSPAALTCISGCGSTDAVWGGRSYDPATAAPFGGGPGCNGRWYLQVAVDGGGFGSGTPFVASAPASPARNVRVAIDGRDAVVTWGRAPEPDVVGYRIERRDAGSWAAVGEAPASADRFVDADLDEGSYEWRVVTLRPDGRGSGSALSACADREADLTTTSATTRGRVTEPPPPPPSPTAAPGPDDDATSGGDGTTSGDGTDGGTTTGDGTSHGPGTGAEAPAAGSGAGTGTPTTEDTSGTPVAAPAAPAPEAPAAPTQEERYYGEDQGVGTLDYGDAVPGTDPDATAAAPAGGTWVPGGVSISTQLDQARILRPVAGGLVLLTFAFHIRRWQREHDV